MECLDEPPTDDGSSDGERSDAEISGARVRPPAFETLYDESFDLVCSFKVLAHVQRIEAALAETADGRAVGIAIFYENFATFTCSRGLYLEDLFVRPEHRGRGIGKALLTRLAQRCVDESLPRLEWSVLDWNQPAIEFYRSLGAKPMDEWTVFRLTDAALAQLSPAGTPSAPR